MNAESILENKTKFTASVFAITAIFIGNEYFNGGVITHHLLADKDLPGFSNWLGLFTVPFLAWIVASLIIRRSPKVQTQIVQRRFLVALLFGLTISILWKLGLDYILQYLILLPLVIAFIRPIHRPEYLLGFVIGMIYAFGGILPIIVGLVLITIGFVINKLVGLIKTFIK